MRAGLFVAILLVFAIALSGCAQDQSASKGVYANFSIDFSVVDSSGHSVNGSDLYTYVGFLSDSGQVYAWNGHPAFVDSSGHAQAYYSFGPVDPHDRVVFGASPNNSSLYDDWSNKRFSPGGTGPWKVWTYDDITRYTKGNDRITINDTIMVSSDTGKMMNGE